MDVAEGIHKRSLAHAYTLNLGAGQDDACGICVDEMIVEGSFLVLYLHRTLLP